MSNLEGEFCALEDIIMSLEYFSPASIKEAKVDEGRNKIQ